ncbi:uncharacterized protein TOT_040000668 [Theileria orientalis strain Shintoku]|uniref:Mechanosensitive ion channel MscS domain-containing protein n=1 Tax=Theileria orientalis strain Shintoku TaxID=869250 RepID=J4DQE2_THEOR|nr:uncharacterized protein TOT_040000668 [Theileria orientalis strain Shintoku]BAM42299.1 uncharacterized protein TOT_040000668 [Theileria orientalis strain Shintoku]|eukprot:XP_009692600.1 uncharacterized protein TOT_040000668 [Theileria orientalis strain Shintoku]
MDLRKSSRFKGLLTKRFSVDSTSTIKSDKDSEKRVERSKKKTILLSSPLDYGDDDALIESGLWSDIKVMLWDFIPDYTPLNFILIQLFAFMVFLSFRAITFPTYIEPENPDENLQLQYEYMSYIKDYFNSDEKQFDLIINTLKLLFILLIINIIVLFLILFVRFIFMKFLFELFSRISRIAVLIAYSVDPGVFYLMCSLINYTVFLRCLIKSWFMLCSLFLGGITPEYTSYKFQMFGHLIPRDFWIDSKCYSYCKSLYHLHILFAVRKLILSTLLFLFELQFLANYSSDLTTYLNELSCLRKFTLKWLNYVYYRKSLRMKELDDLMEKFLNIDMNVVKKSYNTVWMQHRKDDFKIFRPILCKWQYHNIKNDLDLHDYNGTDFLKDLWISSMSIKPSVNWIVLNYVIHNPPEILLLHNSIQLICKDTIDYYSKFLFDQIYDSLTILRSKEYKRLVTVHMSKLKVEHEVKTDKETGDYVEDETLEFYQFSNKALDEKETERYDRSGVDDMYITRDFDNSSSNSSGSQVTKINWEYRPGRERKYRQSSSNMVPELLKYRNTILDPDMPSETCVGALMNKRETIDNYDEEEEDDRYITKEMCSELDQKIVEDFFLSYDISNCSAISCDNFVMAVINMCSIRKKLITTLKNQRSILELVGNLISIILWFMSFVALLLSFRINKNIVLPSTIGLFSATIVALSYMYTSFITAIMFVVISNPYNVGDRVRIDGHVMYVRRITTYNTEFRSSHGKHIIYQNILLSKMLIINESRAKHATLELNLKMSSSTTPAALKMLRDNVKTFVNGRPRDFVNNSIYFHCDKLQVSHYINLVIWATCVESWSNTRAVFGLKSDLMKFVGNQCKLLGIGYEGAQSPIYFKNSLNVGGLEPIINSFNDKGPENEKRGIFKRWDNLLGKGESASKKRDTVVGHKANEASAFYRVEDGPQRRSGAGFSGPDYVTPKWEPGRADGEGRTDKTSFEMISALGPDHHTPEIAHFLWGDPPRPSTVSRHSGTIQRQVSTGPLNIEPTFSGMIKPCKVAGEPRGLRNLTSPEKLHHIPKPTFESTHPPQHRHHRSSDMESYENVWLNTWSPDTRPIRLKTMSVESSYDKYMKMSVEQAEMEQQPQEPQEPQEPQKPEQPEQPQITQQEPQQPQPKQLSQWERQKLIQQQHLLRQRGDLGADVEAAVPTNSENLENVEHPTRHVTISEGVVDLDNKGASQPPNPNLEGPVHRRIEHHHPAQNPANPKSRHPHKPKKKTQRKEPQKSPPACP